MFQSGDVEVDAGPGGLVSAPRGVPHTQRRIVPRSGRVQVPPVLPDSRIPPGACRYRPRRLPSAPRLMRALQALRDYPSSTEQPPEHSRANRHVRLASDRVDCEPFQSQPLPRSLLTIGRVATKPVRSLLLCAEGVAKPGLSGGVWTISGMAQNFIACDRDQELLLPPSLREWLPEDHLAWFVLEAVDELDLDAVLWGLSPRRVGCRGARPVDDGGAAGLRLCDRGAVGAGDRAALSRGRRVPGDLREPDARSRHDRAVSRPPRGRDRRPVRRGAGAVREGGAGEGRGGGGRRHEGRGGGDASRDAQL